MSQDMNLIVGFDLCNDYSQISYYDKKTYEPRSISITGNKGSYLIPTVLAVKKDTSEWFFGENALALSKQNNGFLVKNIISSIMNNERIEVCGKHISGATLLEKFFRNTLSILQQYQPNKKIEKLMITVKELNKHLMQTIYEALDKLGIQKDRISIQSHEQSFLYYALSQKKELWLNDIGLFDYDESGLKYYQITMNRRTNPYIVTVTNKDFSDTLNFDFFCDSDKKDHLNYMFRNIAKSELLKQIVTTLYVTGIGFEGTWVDDVLKELCIGRRVFKGQNLYAKGACYAARELVEEEKKFSDFVFITDEMITSTISIKVYFDARIREIILAKAATAWFDIEQKLEFILDDENEIELIITDVMNKKSISQIITLDGLDSRPNKMTRVEIRAKFEDEHTCVITMKDKGFGEFCPSTNRIYEKVIMI